MRLGASAQKPYVRAQVGQVRREETGLLEGCTESAHVDLDKITLQALELTGHGRPLVEGRRLGVLVHNVGPSKSCRAKHLYSRARASASSHRSARRRRGTRTRYRPHSARRAQMHQPAAPFRYPLEHDCEDPRVREVEEVPIQNVKMGAGGQSGLTPGCGQPSAARKELKSPAPRLRSRSSFRR